MACLFLFGNLIAMQILLIEPYYGGSHQAWADGYKRRSRHDVQLLTMPAQFWKWRMQGGAITMARLLRESNLRPDVILASDMLNLATFRALTHSFIDSPIALYFHENQMTYPQNSRQGHGWRYGFVNYLSALAADAVYFNSPYHHNVFFETLPRMLKHFGDYNELQTVDEIYKKSSVLPLGLDLSRFDLYHSISTDYANSNKETDLIVWNHRWEEDKNPEQLFYALYKLIEAQIPFRVAITGENFRQEPEEFIEARTRLKDHLVQFGYMPAFADYAKLLWQADYVISTAHQEFFGGAIAEAIYCSCIPLLPHRLNYPNLLPDKAHDACLYPEKGLLSRLKRHLMGEYSVDKALLQAHIRQFDWSIMAPIYDDTFEALANRRS